jgi:hypothetical protein
LAVKTGNQIWVYDTLDHRIGGFSQQQGIGGSITFGSQYGTVNLASLPVVSRDGQPVMTAASPASTTVSSTVSESEGDIFAAIERLAQLKEKGILTDEEFAAKKAELLSRV